LGGTEKAGPLSPGGIHFGGKVGLKGKKTVEERGNLRISSPYGKRKDPCRGSIKEKRKDDPAPGGKETFFFMKVLTRGKNKQNVLFGRPGE